MFRARRPVPSLRLARLLVCLGVLALGARLPALAAQVPNKEQIDRAHRILAQIKDDLERHYYDPTFGGIDLNAKYHAADSSLNEAPTIGELFGVVAQFVFDLKDSHTNFYPPSRAAVIEYGWAWGMIGDACYVTAVRKQSNAEAKGLEVGDRVLAIDGMLPTRQSIRLIGYLYYALNPRPGMHVTLQKIDGTRRELDILAKITPTERVVDLSSAFVRSRLVEEWEESRAVQRHHWRSFGDTVLVWRFRSFDYEDEYAIDDMMNRARKHKALIIDLRDNGGGAVITMLRLIGHFFDHDVRVGTVRFRNKTEPMIAKRVGHEPFRGNLIILLNSNSASASEITSRTLQLEGVSTIVGDRSMGAVMVSRYYPHNVGFQKSLPYGISITEQDIIMPNEGRLENVGVSPEFVVLPTAADLAAKRDPQMAKALALAGIHMDPDRAAKILDEPRD